MDVFSHISRFLFRIRYKLIFGSVFAVILAIYFTNFLPKVYQVTTTVFTGITSQTSLDDMSGNTDYNASKNAHDNIINLIHSKSTLERVSLGLLAQHLIYGDSKNDNLYISAAHYNRLMQHVPKWVVELVDTSSVEKTVENFMKHKVEDKNNFIYANFNWENPYYSYATLRKIEVKRKESSDMIEISYQCDDPGIAMNTLALLNNELALRYEDLLLNTSNGVIKYFEEQLVLASQQLALSEDDLVKFNTDNKIINYGEQTKHLSALNNDFESRYETILLAYNSSKALLQELEKRMEMRVTLIKENESFLSTLANIADLNGKIAEIEIFGTNDANNKEILDGYKSSLVKAEDKIKSISDNIDVYKYSKEGVSIMDMVDQWLVEVIRQAKSKAELEVMKQRKKELEVQYEFYSPVGPNLNRKDRGVRVAEEQYLTILNHLGQAHLKQKNILLSSGTLQVVTPPEFPLLVIPRNRELYVIAAFLFAILFIIGVYFIIEFLDRTIRDTQRAEHLTSGKVLGAFPRNDRLKYRGYNKEVYRMATAHMANSLNKYIRPDKTAIVNMLSMENGEGKTFISERLKEYWDDLGFSVQYVSYGTDFSEETKSFIHASKMSDILPTQQPRPDIMIVEYAPLKQSSVPLGLLTEASVNLLITDAQRIWIASDQPIFDALKGVVEDGSLFIYLNNADRETTEEYTGQLPPYTWLRKWSYKIFKLGITAKTNFDKRG